MPNTNTARIARIRRSLALQAKVRANALTSVVDAGATVALCDTITATLKAQLAILTTT